MRRPIFGIAAATATLIVVCVSAAFAQAGAIDVAITSRASQPGEVLRLDVTCACADDVEAATATAFGRSTPLAFVSETAAWSGLVGIDLGTRPGTYQVVVVLDRDDEPPLEVRRRIEVRPKTFRTRRLRVAPGFVTPPRDSLERIADEAGRLQALFATASSGTWEGPYIHPVDGRVTSNFGSRSILNGQRRSPHSGIDYAGSVGTPVVAPAGGVVALADDLYFTGNTVVIDHGLGLYSLLAHLSSFAVKPGDRVERGQLIGQVGATGRVTAPHLHWATRLNTARVDPLALMAVAGAPAK
jgi:murein DD-endopeptidase MepM/ murein hydrolase activator NlpD